MTQQGFSDEAIEDVIDTEGYVEPFVMSQAITEQATSTAGYL
jgi:hypothetical protein